jgi:beta-glucosidase
VLRYARAVIVAAGLALTAPPVALADVPPYSLPVTLPASGSSPSMASDAPFTPLVKSLIAQLLPDNPPTPMELQNAATIMHGIATVPLFTNSEPCNTIGGNLAPSGTNPVISPLCWADAQGVNVESGSQVRQTMAPPMRVAMASSWNPRVLNAWGQVEGHEARYLGITGIYGPQADLMRIPDWGRNLTIFGEDPFQGGTLAAAEVNGIQSQGLMSQIKHFAFYNGQTMDEDSQVQDQAAHELYLQPYEYGTSGSGVLPNPGNASSMMCSYARFELVSAPNVSASPPSDVTPPSGALACDNNLKNYVAHKLWSWPGFFASDYFFAMDSTKQAMDSGTDQEMPTNDFYGNPLVAAVESGAVSLNTFKTALARILYQEERFHLLGHADGNSNYLSASNPIPAQYTTNPVPPPDKPTQPGIPAAMKAGDGAIAERAAEEGAVLLKNDGDLLPLTPADLQKGVLVVGEAGEYMPAGPGTEASDGYLDRDAISPLQQLKELAPQGSKISFSSYMPGTAPTASDGEAVPQAALSTDGTTIGNGLTRTAGPGSPSVDSQIDFTSLSGHGQLQFGQTYTWSGYINVPTQDNYTFRFQFSVPKFTVNNSSGNSGGGLNTPACSGTDSNSGGIAPTFSLATNAGTGQSMSSETLSAAPNTLGTIPTSPTMSGNIERGLGACVFQANNLAAGVHQIQISWTTPTSFDNDPYHLREPGSALPSFRFAYSRSSGDQADTIAAAKQAAKVIVFADCVCVSQSSGGGALVNTLDAGPQQLVNDMVAANPNTIVVTNWDVATLMSGIDKIKSILQMWYPGSEGGTATARLLLGQANPSGHLTSTWPANGTDTIFGYNETKPLYPGDTTGTHSERMNGNGPLIQWTEGDFVGYRFFDREGITPLFPFGWGLSYTTFRYSDLAVKQAGDGLDVSFDVTNTGGDAGATVPQIYIGPAPSVPAGVQQAHRALAGFDRVTLDPGQTAHETIHIGPGTDVDGWGNRRAFEYWDTAQQAWVMAPGPRTVWVGVAETAAELPLTQTGVTPPITTPNSGAGGGGAGQTNRPAACPAASGRLSQQAVGPLRLGMTRARARHLITRHSTHGRRNMDFYCLRPIGIRVGYGYPALLRSLSPAQRRRLSGRIVLVLTADRRYTLRGIRPGTTVRAAMRRVRLGQPFRLGPNVWYVVANGSSRGVLKVRHGIVQEVGIAAPSLAGTLTLARRLLSAFG